MYCESGWTIYHDTYADGHTMPQTQHVTASLTSDLLILPVSLTRTGSQPGRPWIFSLACSLATRVGRLPEPDEAATSHHKTRQIGLGMHCHGILYPSLLYVRSTTREELHGTHVVLHAAYRRQAALAPLRPPPSPPRPWRPCPALPPPPPCRRRA